MSYHDLTFDSMGCEVRLLIGDPLPGSLPAWEAVEAFCKAAGLKEVFRAELGTPGGRNNLDVEGFGQQAKQQQAIFEEVAAAQMNAWRQAADKMLAASSELAADQRAKAEAAVQQMKAGASTAEANLQKLATAGSESWTALNAALAESRAAFDRANQTVWESFKRAS